MVGIVPGSEGRERKRVGESGREGRERGRERERERERRETQRVK